MTDNIQNKHGFTLLETLVAVTILATSIVGPLSIASRSLNNSLLAKDQVTAFFLAQDAVEYVRFVRDTNTLEGNDWLLGSGGSIAGISLDPCNVSTNATGCYVDSTGAVAGFGDIPTVCDTTSGCPLMNYDSTNSRFTYAGTSAGPPAIAKSKYTRSILLTPITVNPPRTEELLTITVSWKDLGNTPRQIQVRESLFKWQ